MYYELERILPVVLTIVPPNMPMARPRAHVSHKKSKSKYAPGVFKAHLRSVALGRTKAHKKKSGGRKKSHEAAE